MSVEKLFYSTMLKNQADMYNVVNVALRHTCDLDKLKASDVNVEQLEELMFRNQASMILRRQRNSEAYWVERRKEVYAMIRQFGPPTFFVTFSPSEIHWPELLRILLAKHKQVNNI